MRNMNSPSPLLIRWLSVAALSAFTVLLVGTTPVSAQTAAELDTDLLQAIEESFEILPASEGILLRPLADGADYRIVEVRGSSIAIDGVETAPDDLEERLGDAAQLILQIVDDDAEEAVAVSVVETDDTGEAAAVAEARAERKRKPKRRRRVSSDTEVVFGGSLDIDDDEIARDVLVIGGALSVDGKVLGDAVVIGGAADVNGEVTGDVVAIGGSLDLGDDAHVMGDAVSVGGVIEQADGALVEGSIEEVAFPGFHFGAFEALKHEITHKSDIDVDFRPARAVFGFGWEVMGLALLVLLALLTYLIATRPVERVSRVVAAEWWKAGLVGLLSQILFVPVFVMIVVVLVISIIGIPFLLLLPFVLLALALVALMGYTGVVLSLGRWAEERFGWRLASGYVAILVGMAMVEIWSLIGELLSWGPGPVKFFAVMFGIFGALLCYAVWTIGFGAAILTRFGTARGWGGDDDVAALEPAEPEPDDGSWHVPLEEDVQPTDASHDVAEGQEWSEPASDEGEPDR